MSPVPDSLHRRLRTATAPAHERLEQDLDWRAQVATREGYRALLARFHGFHAAYEPAIGLALADDGFFDPRRRLAALASDLRQLQLSDAALAALPAPGPVRLDGIAEAMGALYVLEGSTLGGQVIGRHIAGSLGPETPCLYYRAHGERTGPMWAAFRARLDRMPADQGEPVIASAIATFQSLRDWLCDVPVSSRQQA